MIEGVAVLLRTAFAFARIIFDCLVCLCNKSAVRALPALISF